VQEFFILGIKNPPRKTGGASAGRSKRASKAPLLVTLINTDLQASYLFLGITCAIK